MSFSINTNIASLQSRQYLEQTNNYLSRTVQEVTSGLRIVNSGDDAAGLAIANGYRTQEAVLTQGVQNASDGLSQLQIADGGLSNISQLLDRASTLATESASGTFTGDRNVLNNEFQSVLTEINRQAQAIGLNNGGTFAKNLSVLIGGGQASNGVSATQNGSVAIDLSHSTVDTASLGLSGVKATGQAGTDIGSGSATTSLAQILANTTNAASETNPGYTTFSLKGPGFAGNGIQINVDTANLGSTSDLVAAVNAAIQSAAGAGTQQATALKNANIVASINTDATGKQQLTFNSSVDGFQVQAGDRTANALLGNFQQNASITGTDSNATVNIASGVNDSLQISVNGNPAIAASLAGSSGTYSKADIVKYLNTGAANSAFQAAATATLQGNQIVIQSKDSSSASSLQIANSGVSAAAAGLLGLSTSKATAASPSTGADLRTYVTAANNTAATGTTFGAVGAGTITFQFQGAGQSAPTNISLTTTANETIDQAIAGLQTAVANNTNLKAAGITLTTATTGEGLTFTSTSGQAFNVQVTGDAQNLFGFGSFVSGPNGAVDYNQLIGGSNYNSATAVGADTFQISLNGGASNTNAISVDLTAGDATAANVTGGSLAGPVSAITGDNNALNLAVNGHVFNVTLTPGTLVTANSIANQINTVISGQGAATVNGNNQIVITSNTKGAGGSVQILSGTANSLLGFTAGAAVTGTSRSGASVAQALNQAFASNPALQAAGLVADYGVTQAGRITVSSSNGTYFRINSSGSTAASQLVSTVNGTTGATEAYYTGGVTGNVAITAGNSQFGVSVNGGAAQTVQLTTGASYTLQQVANEINSQINNAVASVNTAGDLVLTSTTPGVGNVAIVGGDASATIGVSGGAATQGTAATSGAVTGSVNTAVSITTGTNDALKVTVDGGSLQTITLTQGNNQSLAAIATQINGQITGATASVDSSGHLVITSSSSGAASSVLIGNGNADATLGLTNAQTGTGTAAAGGKYTGNVNVTSVLVNAGQNQQFSVSVNGGAAQLITIAAGITSSAQLTTQINAQLVGATASINGSNDLVITSNTTGVNSSIAITAGSNAPTALGLTTATGGAATAGAAGAGTFTFTGANNQLSISVNGGAAQVFTLTGSNQTAAQVANQITTAGLTGATVSAVNGYLEFQSTATGAAASITINAPASNANATLGLTAGTYNGTQAETGFGVTGVSFTGNVASAAPSQSAQVDSGGASETSALSFTPLVYGNENQAITLSAPDPTGTQQSLTVTLSNNSTSRSGESLDAAINAINTALQQSNNSTLNQIVAVKDNSSGTEQIRFLSQLNSFQVTIGTTPQGDGIGSQGTTATSSRSAGGSTADITSQASAEAAVTALSKAVTILGSSQAVVGRGENQFNYAINLANSQLTNFQAAESTIRDADLATESANLTKAQILLQAGVAALAQANSAPQQVLSLLKG